MSNNLDVLMEVNPNGNDHNVEINNNETQAELSSSSCVVTTDIITCFRV